MSSQEVGMGLSFDLPVNLAKIGTGYLTENPVAGFLVSLLAFFVLAAVLVVPIAALLGVEIFPGLVPHSRSLSGDVDLWTTLEKLTDSKVVEDFLSEPLDDFLQRVMGDRQARSTQTVGGFLARAARALTPALSLLDYDNAFVAVQVPGEECRQRLMCHVHSQLPRLPPMLQRAYGYLGPHMKHQEHYSQAILTGLSGSECDLAFPDCPYNVLQMASFVPFLRSRNHHANQL